MRAPSDKGPYAPAGAEIDVSATDGVGHTFHQSRVKTDSFGAFTAEILAPEDMAQGYATIEARAGRAGAKIRTGPARNSRIIVRVESGAAVTITGTLQHGGHRWFLVTLQDGREGFARDDVIVSSEGGAVRL